MILEQQNHSLPADCHKSSAKKGQHEEDTQAVKIFSFYFIYLGVEKKGTAFQKVTSLQWVLKVYHNVDFVLHKGENKKKIRCTARDFLGWDKFQRSDD